MDDPANKIVTTYPYEGTSACVARHQCTECGKWERSDKGSIRHSKGCEGAEPGREGRRESYAAHVRDLADRNPSAVQQRDWDLAMNRDD
jgi:hypothetical protein